jgi:hypothetical protein
MKPDDRFLRQPKPFWANVRSISQHHGYTARAPRGKKGDSRIITPSIEDICTSLRALGLETDHVLQASGEPTQMGQTLVDYYLHRADALNGFVRPRLMDMEKARRTFEEWRRELAPRRPVPMNKQKGDKKAPAFLTGLVNMIIESNIEEFDCDYDPRELTTLTMSGMPLRTLARRVDGAFPSTVNPIAIWEVKEYYYTKTFGSRVADGVYESLLDGMELEELRDSEKIDVKHYLMVDDRYTWWNCGKSYLCRLIDMLHMGYVDEILFGYEVVERLPSIVAGWVAIAKEQRGKSPGAS